MESRRKVWRKVGENSSIFIGASSPTIELPPDIAHVTQVMERMPTWQRLQVVKIVDTVAEPADKAANGSQ